MVRIIILIAVVVVAGLGGYMIATGGEDPATKACNDKLEGSGWEPVGVTTQGNVICERDDEKREINVSVPTEDLPEVKI